MKIRKVKLAPHTYSVEDRETGTTLGTIRKLFRDIDYRAERWMSTVALRSGTAEGATRYFFKRREAIAFLAGKDAQP